MLTYIKVGNDDIVHPVHREEQFFKQIQLVRCQSVCHIADVAVVSANIQSFQA